ncbi:cytochrome P450 [Bradyrhizobium erythrophlei]|uniref:cytochrome P450 n=1 Tax=Bradyrhizobium erythrophlei TaxID=1437360 RepID=UPI0035E91157
MFKSKYYARIKAAQRKTKADDANQPFDLDQLGADSWRRRITVWLTGAALPPLLFLLREFWPVATIGSFVVVTRYADVCSVLAHPELFEVPFDREMKELGGEHFVLGLEGSAHDEQNRLIRTVLGGNGEQSRSEVVGGPATTDEDLLRAGFGKEDAEHLARLSNRYAKALIRASGGRIDVMKDFITRVAAETCIRYFGLQVDDPDIFAEWTMSISALLFADPCGAPATRQLALNGAARVRAVIDRSIAETKKRRKLGADVSDTVLGRLLLRQETDGTITNEKIRAILLGLATGFIPTNTLAAGKILQELLRRPDAMRDAVEKARRAREIDENSPTSASKLGNPDRKALQAALLEAARLNPALAPGQWRFVKSEAEIGSGASRRTIAKGKTLIVSTMSALRDRRAMDRPGAFRTNREPSSWDLLFGTGVHECLGKHLAISQITEIFMILLSQENLRRRPTSWDWWGGIRWTGPFPRWLDMDFDPPTSPSTQTMMTICAPIEVSDGERTDTKLEEIRRQIAELGNPSARPMRGMLDETGIVHFASLSMIDAGDDGKAAPHLLLELNVDGSTEAAIQKIAAADRASRTLHSIFRNTPKGKAALAEILNSYVRDLRTRPWGVTGINFNGTPEFSVPDIAMQESLSTFARDALDLFLMFHVGIGNRAMKALDFVRSFIVHPERWANIKPSGAIGQRIEDLLARGAKFSEHDVLVVPSRRRLKISDWQPCTKREAVFKFLKTWDYWSLALPALALAALFAVAVFHATATDSSASIVLPGRIILALVGGALATLSVLAIVGVGFLALLRYHETKDIPDDRNPVLHDVATIAGVENPPGFAQNHFMAVTALKPGWFRKLTLAMSLWGIKQMVLNYFRPGFVLNMGTIHYAKWFRLPGHDKLVFQANYDGSWESYLEDFIMKAHLGQTAAWSNGVGFPRTRYLILDGAQNGDRFKRWVRRQQVLSPFWYSRFPHLTTDQIRRNALIHDGLARASTDSAARAWLDCFGSIPRPDYVIETDEVQSLLFRGQRYLRYAICALIRLPDTKAARAEWLEKLVPGAKSPHSVAELDEDEDGAFRITFGDHPFSPDRRLQNLATFVGFSAAGLHKLGLSEATQHDGLGAFPNTFNMGMANRSRSLGDFGQSSPAGWRWSDATPNAGPDGCSARPSGADAVLLIYAQDALECEKALADHVATLGKDALIHVVPTQPAIERISYEQEGRARVQCPLGEDLRSDNDVDYVLYEHFGFRDGISQPAIRGSQRFLKGVQKRDIVEPGEFILGYRNNQGYYPPTATVRADSDQNEHLPVVLADAPSEFPSFEGNSAVRDFGRNGSFLVVRQLAQDVAGFAEFLDAKARQIDDDYPNLADTVGARINAKWLAAKMIGRWPDGTALVERPGADREESPRKGEALDNKFSYGVDDPQGLHCPLGAHIRRANPRDSLQPDDPGQQSITNRHRLLRRGRPYAYRPSEDAETEKGLLFMCLCADLDRQFEFVQQTWIQSPSFHGLRDEPDPMVAWSDPKRPRSFTIPTASGPVQLHGMKTFVTARAGGYFFLPSRSAIQYLIDINQPG